jgi:hypothetical protein
MTPKTYRSETGPTRRNAGKRDRSWSLLMVGDHGQIIPFRRVKGIAIALITVATLAILAAVGLGLWGGWLRVQHAALRSELEASREAVQKLRDEKDLLMAKVVILETQTRTEKKQTTSEKAPAADTKAVEKEVLEAKTVSAPAGEKKGAQVAKTAVKPEKREVVAPPMAAAPPTPIVAVSGFIADHSPRRDTLSARFKIQNVGARGRKISGRCVLVMKNEVESDRPWVSVPHVSLISGRPNGKQGRTFRIANYMTLMMRTREVPDNFAFETGTLYVFDDAGQQLLEKQVPVQLRYRKPKPAPKPAPQPPPAAEPTPSPAPEPAASQPAPPPAPQSRTDAADTETAEVPSTVNTPPVAPAAAGPTAEAPSPPSATSDRPPPVPTPTVAPVPETGPGGAAGDDPSLPPGSEGVPATASPEPGEADVR